MIVVQLLPELNEGGVERGVVELNREYVKLGITSFVISNGGKLENQINIDGGTHIKFDVCSKNIFTVISRINGLKKILKDIKPDIIHVRSRVPAWLIFFANKSLGIKVVSTVHGFNSVGFYSSIMQKADAVICVSNSIKEYIQKRITGELHTKETKVKYILKDIADESATRGPYRPEYVVVGAEVVPSYLE